MSDYVYDSIPKNKKVIWLKVIENAWHGGITGRGILIPKNSITWILEKHIYKVNGGIYLCENNRHCSNYQQKDFEIISNPDDEKEMLLTTIL